MIDLPSCSCGSGMKFVKLLQDQQLIQFLMGLNDHYITARGTILMMQPMPNLNQAYGLILQDERQRELQSFAKISNESIAMAAQKSFNNQAPGFDRFDSRNYYNNRGNNNSKGISFLISPDMTINLGLIIINQGQTMISA